MPSMSRRNTWPFSSSSFCLGCLCRYLDTSPEEHRTAAARPRILIYILRRDVRLSDNPIFHSASSFSSRCIGRNEHDTHESQASLTSRSSPTSNTRNEQDFLTSEVKSHSLRNSDSESLPISNKHDKIDSLTSEAEIPSFTHLLPVYVFPANQVEISGFLSPSVDRSPYPEARSYIAGIWRTGPHRAKFTAEGVWSLKEKLEGLECGSGLELRVGMIGEVVEHILDWYSEKKEDGRTRADVAGIWMTAEEGCEEKSDENEVSSIAEQRGVHFKVWEDEKYYIEDRDQPFDNISDVPNIYTTYRKSLEPLRSRPRRVVPTPTQLPPLPPEIPPQKHPFVIPTSLSSLEKCLLFPFVRDPTSGLPSPLRWPPNTQSAHPFKGGEKAAHERLSHLLSSGAMSTYKTTRNNMLGLDFSTKLAAYLAQGHLTARQIHWAMVDFEEGRGDGEDVESYGKGENEGTAAVRFELLWRDFMRLYAKKFGTRIFHLKGIRDDASHDKLAKENFRRIDKGGSAKALEDFTRFRSGQTGIGLIDASNRELVLTGYTSNRARQNVASFFSSHLGIDWRIGAEWYECLLTDYDVANNWGNWQYISGVGNDPKQGRMFNPIKQSFDYDGQGEYIKAWVPELRGVRLTRTVGLNEEEIDKQRLGKLYQAWMLAEWEKQQLGLRGVEWAEKPLVKIHYSPRRDAVGGGRGRGNWRGRGRGKRSIVTVEQDEDREGRGPNSNVIG